METAKLKKFAQLARRTLLDQVSAKLKLVLAENSSARRESTESVNKLEEAIRIHGKDQVIEKVAYTWFNRFCALRFMDVNRYTRIGVVSPAEGQFQPEILAEAKMGHIDEEMVQEKTKQQIFDLLSGRAPSRDPQGEAYRLLVVASCNFFHRAMPFLFQRIDDYTELLMPDDLLSGNSILAYTREAMTTDACKDVEVIGWLYQFYISEKKDEVFEGLKKNKKITPENIPAATQLFTPHWIVKYLVENSLGRLWMLNRPNSRLKEKMEYFITTEDTENTESKKAENSGSSVSSVVENDFLVVNSPEEIKICDPACGSGHMLTYAFDLLYAIYEEEGYEPAEIPEKILTNNLYGIEIDERAGVLAAFALTMKALQYDKRFFRRATSRGHLVEPNICVLKNIHFKEDEINKYMDLVGRDLFTAPLQTTLRQFEEADNFGSLIRPEVTDTTGMLKILESKNVSGHLFLSPTHEKVLQALRQADYLSPKYHVVIANPPYMGGKGMNGRLAAWVKDNYPNSKSDLFAMFIERNLDLAQKHGAVAMITMQSWMFLSSFEALRARLLGQSTLLSMAHLGARAFDSIGGEVVSTTAFVLENSNRLDYKGGYLRLVAGNSEAEKNEAIREAVKNSDYGWIFRSSAADFKKIPGSPIAYWVKGTDLFEGKTIGDLFVSGGRNKTHDNEKYLRYFWEVRCQDEHWVSYANGGDFRKYAGNELQLVDWSDDARDFYDSHGGLCNPKFWNKEGITWSLITSAINSFRIKPTYSQYSSGSPTIFNKNYRCDKKALAFLNSPISYYYLKAINPTLNTTVNDVFALPFPEEVIPPVVIEDTDRCIDISRVDWDAYETSWDFTILPLLNPDYCQPTLKATYQKLRAHWREMTLELQWLEEENNRIFIEAYGLQDELKPEVPLNEITLTCNPYYRYGKKQTTEQIRETTEHTENTENKNSKDSDCSVSSVVKTSFPIDDELEALLLADTMRELVSYAVGCMFGRYSLEKPGLILANQGETTEDYYKKIGTTEHTENTENKNSRNSVSSVSSVVKTSFPPDEDNVIPILDGDWFTDDITERFKRFLRVAFGAEYYEENLRFVEESLKIKGKRNYGIRDYFLGGFYTDHVKRYKKRPIYWLFSSPKGSFNALIYMHRYRPDTLSIVLNDYLREYRTKLASHKTHLEAVSIRADVSQAERTRALKEIEKVGKMINELEEYEREVLYPLATERIEIDLDDGVKANYPRFGGALKKIPGLDAQGED